MKGREPPPKLHSGEQPLDNVKLTRDDSGVLTVELRTNGGPCLMTAQTHTEFVEAFYRISQDRANKIVILTGAGGDFITDVAWSSWGNPGDPGVWSQIHDEGVQVLENIANIPRRSCFVPTTLRAAKERRGI